MKTIKCYRPEQSSGLCTKLAATEKWMKGEGRDGREKRGEKPP